MSHLIIFTVDEMRCAHHQIQLCIYERTHGTFDELHWPVKVKYNDHHQSIDTYEKSSGQNTMDGIQHRFLERAR